MRESKTQIIQILLLFIGAVYLLKLFYLQVIDQGYSQAANDNAIEEVVQIPQRGQIYDRHGQLIVYNTPTYDLFITPKKAKVKDTLRFCNLLGINRFQFDSLTSLARKYSKFKASLFLRQLSVEEFARIQDSMVDYPGFTFETNAFRTYTAPTMANTLGYIAEVSPQQLKDQEERGEEYYRQGDYIGKSGLEKYYEQDLRGRRGVKYIMKDVHGVVKGPWRGGDSDVLPTMGKNLYTSIDLPLQQYADSLFKNKLGGLVALDPKTGEILAIVSSPSYDPKLLSGRNYSKNYGRLVMDAYKPLLNRPLQGLYRPGSTFKVIQSLVAMQEGAITSETSLSHAGAPVRCHCGGRGGGNVARAIQYSCNPYFYHVFRRFINKDEAETNAFKRAAGGLKKWDDYVAKFGIGQKLGVDLPYEMKGKLPDGKHYDKVYKGEYTWKFSNIYSLGIGEGELQVSPLQLANVAAIIANKGWYITPHMVRAVGSPKAVTASEYTKKHDVGIEKRHFEPLIEGMYHAVYAGTVMGSARIPDLEVCGKTGTSQNKRPPDNGIFLGFAPRNNPKIAIAAFVDRGVWGGTSAAPIAILAMERYIKGKTTKKDVEKYIINRYLLPEKPKPLGDSTTKNLVTKIP